MVNNLGIFKTICLILTFGMSLSACSKSASWKEEAFQHDGSKVIVQRTVIYGGRHEFGQPSPFKEETLAFTLPKSSERVVWKNPYSDDVGRANFNPMLVEVYGDTAYVLSSPDGVISESKWGCPNPPYVLFRYWNKEWKRVPLGDLPAEVKLPNLVITAIENVATNVGNNLVTAAMVKEENQNLMDPQYKTIIRQAPPAGPCLVPLPGGGWGSPGGAKAPGGPFLPNPKSSTNKN